MAAQVAIVGSGTAMGIVHALTGPDHMSALITVAVNGRLQAFWLGARWGVGHSAGLVLVTVVMLVLRDSFGVNESNLLEDVEVVMNWFVGLAMLGLGFWSYYRANKLRRAYLATLEPGYLATLEPGGSDRDASPPPQQGRGGASPGRLDRTVLLPMRLPGTGRSSFGTGRCSVGFKGTTLPLAEVSRLHMGAGAHASAIELVESPHQCAATPPP